MSTDAINHPGTNAALRLSDNKVFLLARFLRQHPICFVQSVNLFSLAPASVRSDLRRHIDLRHVKYACVPCCPFSQLTDTEASHDAVYKQNTFLLWPVIFVYRRGTILWIRLSSIGSLQPFYPVGRTANNLTKQQLPKTLITTMFSAKRFAVVTVLLSAGIA